MTRTPVRPRSASAESVSQSAVLAGVLRDIAALGLHARVFTSRVAGEPDVRVRAWRDGSSATAELLWPGPDETAPSQLYAVRIQDDVRAVWHSPHGRCVEADMVRFLCDLLLLDAPALHRHYRRLG